MKIQSINPATGEINKEFETYATADVKNIVKKANSAFKEWSMLDVSTRAEFLLKLATVLRQKSAEYGRIITLEMGKPIRQSAAEVEKCAYSAEVIARSVSDIIKDEPVVTEFKKTLVVHQPIGVILGVMPWNFPFWQALRFAMPSLAVGNTAILRHSNMCPMSALAIEEAFKLAGFPDGTFTTIITDHDEVKRLIKNPLIAGVSVTGSTQVGRQIGMLAGKSIKKVVLELGGSDAFVVLEDADVDVAATNAAESRLLNTGQSCICAKRFIVVEKVAEQFTNKFVEMVSKQKIGDPLDPNNTVGPLANMQQLEILESQVNDSVVAGAKIACGGKRVNGRGFFFEPTVLVGVKPNMRVAKEEVFGPVGPIIVVKNEKEAIKVANNTNLGLGASVWTKDIEKGERIAREFQSGLANVNKYVRSDPRLPFGGVKDSGVGRELSRYGLLEFTNTKSIIIS